MHRNSQKRIVERDRIYFIKTNTFEKFPYFENEVLCWLFIAQLKMTKILKGFELYAFCLLYDHVHLMLKPNDEFDITKIMFTLKKQFSHSANRVMGYTPMRNARPFSEGGETFARFQKTGGLQTKMLDYVENLGKKYQKEKTLYNEIPKFKWQSSYYDHIIRSQKDFENHYEYTVQNFRKEKDQEKYKYPNKYKFTSTNCPKFTDNPHE